MAVITNHKTNIITKYLTIGTLALCTGAVALVLSNHCAHAAGLPHLNRQLEAIVRRVLPANFSVSAQVADLDSGLILMETHPDLPLVPASTLKVVTSAAALKTLHPEFTFLTEVLVDKVKGSSVGNMYLRGTGDPYLVSEELFALTRALRDKGLTEVTGNIIADDSYLIPSKPLDEADIIGSRAYHAPYGALSLNFNSIKVMVHPAERVGKLAVTFMDPVSEYASLKVTAKTVEGNSAPRLEIVKGPDTDDRELITVKGEIGVKSSSWSRYTNVSVPALYTGQVLKEFLLREGITVNGKVIRGKTPSNAVSYYQFNSRPLGSVVYWLNKFSNNFMAEQICLVMGAEVHGVPGTREKGLSVMKEYLRSCAVDEGCYTLTEASGLSRGNRCSASALVKVLIAASRDFTYNAEFAASLGVAGIDGTLKDKFTEPGVRRRLRAKTGTLRGVNSLAGYGKSSDGKTFVFAVLVNSLRDGAGLVRYADDIAREIMEMRMAPTR